VTVVLGGVEVCRTTRAWRVLETSHPPGWYLPRADWLPDALEPADGASFCEFKGVASYLDVIGGGVRAAARRLDLPVADVGVRRARRRGGGLPGGDGRVRRRRRARPPAGGGFYGGWITDDVVGPFKGAPGTLGW
jgi:hypothetical protein